MLAGPMNENHLFIAGSNMMSQHQYMQFIEMLIQKCSNGTIVSFRCSPFEYIEISPLCFQLKTALTVNVDRYSNSACVQLLLPLKKIWEGRVWLVHRLQRT